MKGIETEFNSVTGDYIIYNGDKSMYIHEDSLSDAYYKDYEHDVKVGNFNGDFNEWVADNGKVFEYAYDFFGRREDERLIKALERCITTLHRYNEVTQIEDIRRLLDKVKPAQ